MNSPRPRRSIPLVVALATAVLFACTTDTLIGPKDVAFLVIQPDTVVMPVGDTVLLEGIATDSRGVRYIGEHIAWTSSNPSVVTITTDGHLISVAVGSATVTAAAGGKSASAQVVVTPPALIAVNVDSLAFGAVARGPLPASQQVIVTNGSTGVLTGLTAGPSVYAGPDTGWLSVSSPSSTAPDSLVFSVALDSFPAGTYTATVPITATKASNSPTAVKVTLTLSTGAPAAVAKTAGDSQTAVVKVAVPTAPAVSVKDAYGNAIAGVAVTFATTAGNGSIVGGTATTNASGVATVGAWTLDSVAKVDTLTATVGALPSVTFTATATHAAATQILKTAGDGQTAPAGSLLPTAPSVAVRDAYGNAVAGATVTFAVTAVNGTVTGATPTTNALGVATIGSWTLGTAARSDTLTATVSGIGAPAIFTAIATAGAATTIAKSAGGTTGTVNANVSPTPAVIVTDQFGNPVAGVGVTFAATASNGTVTGGSVTTNASGIATVGSFKLATLARTDTLTATSGSLSGSPLVFPVIAGPDVPATATKFAGDTQTTTAGALVPVAPAVLVKDQFGNPTPGVTVTFTPVTGSVTGATPATNAAGVATVGSWRLGNTAGSNSLQANAGALATLTFTASGTAGAAKNLALAGTSTHADTIGATLALDSVKVTDSLGNPVAGTTVTWGAGGSGSLTASSVSNAAGIAVATRVLGTAAGTVTDTARVSGLTGSPLLFTTTATAGQPNVLIKGAGDGQSDTVAATLPVAYTDTVKDRGGNPVAGVTVTWGISGGGSITPSSVTSANGVASASRTLGTTAGTQGATGTLAGVSGSPTSFSATATHGAAKALVIVAGTNNQAATISTAVSPPPASKVTDQFGNPVSGVTVTYALGAGGAANGAVTGTSPATDGTGVAALGTWTLSSTAKPDTVTATAAGLTGSPLTFVDFANAGTATTIALAGGNNQSDTVGATLPRLDSVLVTDVGSNPVSGVAVTWAVTKGGGGIPASSITSTSGIATAPWTLGDTAGTQTATATVSGLAGSPVTFTATALHGNAKSLAVNAGGGQTDTVAGTLPTPPSVIVKDAHGNVVPGVPVTFALGAGGALNGSIGTTSTATDAGGTASVGTWTLGTGARTDTVTATSGSLTGSPLVITAVATAATPTSMAVSAGDGQTAPISTLLPVAPAVLVKDQFNNPVPGVPVSFTTAPGNGTLAGSSPLTDATGVATIGSWTTGSVVKRDTATATVTGVPSLTFVATVTPGGPSSMVLSSGDGQTDTIGATLTPLKVLITDAGGNPVPNVTVNWLLTAGSATRSPASSLTDATGIAADTVVLGTTPGTVTLQAGSTGLTSVNFTATVLDGNPTTIAQNLGDGQTATVNTAVATAPSVKVTDRAGNGVSGVGVTFGVALNNGSVTGAAQSTNASGIATVGSWVLDSIAAHANTLTATSGGLTGSPVTFSATGIAGPVSTAKSTLTSSNASLTACSTGCTTGGGTASTITVTELDQFGNPISGGSVIFQSTGSGNTFSPASGSTNASGVVSATFNATTAESKTISVTGGVTQTQGITVSPAAVDVTQSTVAVSSGSMTACSTSCVVGSTAVTVTVTVKDAFGNVRPGSAVAISAGGSGNTLGTPNGTTGAGGTWTSTYNSTAAAVHNVSATANTLSITQTQNVTVNAAAASSVTVTNGGFSARVGTGVTTRPTYTVKDAFGNVVPSQSFTLSVAGGGSAAPTSGTTNASGQITLTSWTMGGTSADASNGTMSNTAQLTAGSASGTATDFGIYTWSGDASPLISTGSVCAGCHAWTYANTVGAASGCGSLPTIIVASSAATSDLYNKISSGSPTCGGAQMPPVASGYTLYTAAQQKIIRAWINNGAQNN